MFDQLAMSFVFFRVVSWIVAVPEINRDDPRNHTNRTRTKYTSASNPLNQLTREYGLRSVALRSYSGRSGGAMTATKSSTKRLE